MWVERRKSNHHKIRLFCHVGWEIKHLVPTKRTTQELGFRFLFFFITNVFANDETFLEKLKTKTLSLSMSRFFNFVVCLIIILLTFFYYNPLSSLCYVRKKTTEIMLHNLYIWFYCTANWNSVEYIHVNLLCRF